MTVTAAADPVFDPLAGAVEEIRKFYSPDVMYSMAERATVEGAVGARARAGVAALAHALLDFLADVGEEQLEASRTAWRDERARSPRRDIIDRLNDAEIAFSRMACCAGAIVLYADASAGGRLPEGVSDDLASLAIPHFVDQLEDLLALAERAITPAAGEG
jgi:hypothetical protein